MLKSVLILDYIGNLLVLISTKIVWRKYANVCNLQVSAQLTH